jgi:hypothetical protein
MSRSLTLSNLYARKFKTIEFEGVLGQVLGAPEQGGAWIIMGQEKHGKTALSLLLAQELSKIDKNLYVSGEEGCGADFVSACQRLNLDPQNRNIHFTDYISIDELRQKLAKRRSAKFVFIDNLTVYRDELSHGVLRKLLNDFPDTLFIFLAHVERNEPYTATAKLVRKLAKVIFTVEGLSVKVSGRVPGGNLIINEQQAQLYHGNNNNDE